MTDEKVDATTVGELRAGLNEDRNVTMMIDKEKGFGVICAQGESLAVLVAILLGSGTNVEVSNEPLKTGIKA